MTTDSEIGARIAHLRGDARLSQDALADLMRREGFKWAQATVWSVESGSRPIRLTEAVAVGRILKAPMAALVGSDSDLEEARNQQRLRTALASFDAAKREVEQALGGPIHVSGQLAARVRRM